ncbi:MAG: hypothetical protein P4L10_05145 [Acidobacteriaceae bacterium]|jgi:3-deoxy-D-manno-octulosonic acid (KDO) 8-phosphate synthase|nr:hypothetical protein [Acidobacteriaceae bacterium]
MKIHGWERFARVARPPLRDASHSSQKRDEWGTQSGGWMKNRFRALRFGMTNYYRLH